MGRLWVGKKRIQAPLLSQSTSDNLKLGVNPRQGIIPYALSGFLLGHSNQIILRLSKSGRTYALLKNHPRLYNGLATIVVRSAASDDNIPL